MSLTDIPSFRRQHRLALEAGRCAVGVGMPRDRLSAWDADRVL